MLKLPLIISVLTVTLFAENKYQVNFISHQENYILFAGHSNNTLTQKYWNSNGTRNYSKEYKRDSNEAQFQLSFKIPLANNLLDTQANLFFAYTQNSFWQVYDKKHSSPFRETNYMPEIFAEWHPTYKIGNSSLDKVRLSLVHQSNGKDIGASRSWNRTQLHLLFKNENLSYGIDIWDRWNEKTKKSIDKATGDDNPDLEKYIGKQKYFIEYKSDNYKLVLSHQNDIFNYDSSKGNTKVDFIFPSMHKKIDFFIRYFNGYGESLIDYDVKIQRVGFGVMLASWE